MTFSLPTVTVGVVLEDGDGPRLEWEDIELDQRDARRAIVACGISDPGGDPIGFLWAQAWAALTRKGLLEIGWSEFQRRVIGVAPMDNGDETTVDPTNPTVGAG
jgi:hypothetical protein